jgi:DNA-directed RNA polymerase subunit H
MASTNKNPIKEKIQEEVIKDLKKSVNDHKLVPAHRIIEDEAKKKLLEKYKIKLKNLPKISIKDPVVKTLKDAKVGDVVEIKRSSTTAGEAIYYRVIIND